MRKGRSNSGAVLLMVMVIITLSALIGTTVLFAADAQRGTAQLTVSQAQLRALAWSGVQASMAELASQRGALLDGKAPTLTKSWSLYEGGGTGSVRLAVIGPAEAQWTSENSRLDINVCTKEMLANLPGMNEELAAKVISARGQGFGSPEELARVEGLSPTLLVGALTEKSTTADTAVPGLLSMVTVFSFDPNFAETSGGEAELKINVSGGWSQELQDQIAERLGAEVGAALQPLLKTAGKPSKDSELVDMLQRGKVPVDQWDTILAAITTSDEQFARGKVDLNTASVDVLACVPGIERSVAEKIVETRDGVDAQSRGKVTWPVTQKLIEADKFKAALPWLTARSMQWRVRVEARVEGTSRETSSGASGGSRTTKIDEEEVDRPGMVWEAVIDVSDSRARVAYMRDVTYLGAVVARAVKGEESASENPVVPKAAAELESEKETDEEGLGTVKSQGLKSNGRIKIESMKGGGGLNLGTDLSLGDSGDAKPEKAESTRPQEEPGASPAPTAKDRRIGRWRGTAKE